MTSCPAQTSVDIRDQAMNAVPRKATVFSTNSILSSNRWNRMLVLLNDAMIAFSTLVTKETRRTGPIVESVFSTRCFSRTITVSRLFISCAQVLERIYILTACKLADLRGKKIIYLTSWEFAHRSIPLQST